MAKVVKWQNEKHISRQDWPCTIYHFYRLLADVNMASRALLGNSYRLSISIPAKPRASNIHHWALEKWDYSFA
jgi:hypothetical protein